MRRFVFFFIFSISALLLVAKDGNGHANDMKKAFPFAIVNTNQKNNKVFKFFELVNGCLDYANFPDMTDKHVGNPPFVTEDSVFSQLSFGNHRIWFHWGFNANPHKFAPLANVLDIALCDSVLSQQDYERFWETLIKKQSERNKYLTDNWKQIMEITYSPPVYVRDQINAFVTIAYSIHILGDYSTSEISLLQNKSMLYADIYNALEKLGAGNSKNKQRLNAIKRRLKPYELDPAKFLSVLQQDFTPYLYSLEGIECNYKTKFERLGFKLKDVEVGEYEFKEGIIDKLKSLFNKITAQGESGYGSQTYAIIENNLCRPLPNSYSMRPYQVIRKQYHNGKKFMEEVFKNVIERA